MYDVIEITGSDCEDIFNKGLGEIFLCGVLPKYLMRSRWFAGKSCDILTVQILEDIVLNNASTHIHILFILVSFNDGHMERYLLPVTYIGGQEASVLMEEYPASIICKISFMHKAAIEENQAVIVDALYVQRFRAILFDIICKNQRLKGARGVLDAKRGMEIKAGEVDIARSVVLNIEQSNTSITYDNRFILKLYRRQHIGVNPELEFGRLFHKKNLRLAVPEFAGDIVYTEGKADEIAVGIMQGYVPNHGDAWRMTLDEVERFFERALASDFCLTDLRPQAECFAVKESGIPEGLKEVIGAVYLDAVELLGKRVAELHLASAKIKGDASFKPEQFTQLYQRSLYQSLHSQSEHAFTLLQRMFPKLEGDSIEFAVDMLSRRQEIFERLKAIYTFRIDGFKIRIHGDLHLGQVLYTGNDFVIIDFEGEPAKALSERRLKRSPLVDAAGMIRSFHYAVNNKLQSGSPAAPESRVWADVWFTYVSGTFMKSYLHHMQDSGMIPKDPVEISIMLDVYMIEKAVYEITYELNNRPAWVVIPLSGLKRILDRDNARRVIEVLL